jgi:hypothetical protein
MSSIQTPDLRKTASGAIRFRRLIDFIRSIDIRDYHNMALSSCSWEELLTAADIVDVKEIKSRNSFMPNRSVVALIRDDGTFFETRFPYRLYQDLIADWSSFINFTFESRGAILDAVMESSSRSPMEVRRSKKTFVEAYGSDLFDSPKVVDDDEELA